MGDALRYIEEGNAARGFLFDGRVAEDFKLNTGTWVSVGPLRSAFLAHFVPYAKEVVIAGRDRACVTAMVFPECERLPGTRCDSALREKFGELLTSFAAKSTGLSTRVAALFCWTLRLRLMRMN